MPEKLGDERMTLYLKVRLLDDSRFNTDSYEGETTFLSQTRVAPEATWSIKFKSGHPTSIRQGADNYGVLPPNWLSLTTAV